MPLLLIMAVEDFISIYTVDWADKYHAHLHDGISNHNWVLFLTPLPCLIPPFSGFSKTLLKRLLSQAKIPAKQMHSVVSVNGIQMVPYLRNELVSDQRQ